MVNKTKKDTDNKRPKMLNEITEKLISTMQTNSDNQKLWQVNCITYSVAVVWREINSEISENSGVKTRNKGASHLENIITQTRQLLSKTKAEREAQMKGAKMTKKNAGKEEGKFKQNARRFRLRALWSSLISSGTV